MVQWVHVCICLFTYIYIEYTQIMFIVYIIMFMHYIVSKLKLHHWSYFLDIQHIVHRMMYVQCAYSFNSTEYWGIYVYENRKKKPEVSRKKNFMKNDSWKSYLYGTHKPGTIFFSFQYYLLITWRPFLFL